MTPDRCFTYTGSNAGLEANLAARLAAGTITEKDASAVRNFAAWLNSIKKPPTADKDQSSDGSPQ